MPAPKTARALFKAPGGIAQAEKCLAIVDEMERLHRLTPKQLVDEVLASHHGDALVVIELLNRVCPGWEMEGLG